MPVMQSRQETYDYMVCSSVSRLIITLAVPSVLSLMISSFYNLADTYFVGQIGTSATAAVGVAYPLMTLIQAIGLMFGKGCGTSVARLLGKQDTEQAEEMAIWGVSAVFAFTSVLMLAGLLLTDPLTIILGSTPTIAPFAKAYMVYVLIAMPFHASSVTLSSLLRFQGMFTRSMVGLSSGAILNVVLDPIFIFGLGMGIKGAAMATMLSEMVSFFILLLQFRNKASIHLSFYRLRFSWKALIELLSGGLPSFMKNGLSSIAAVLLNTAAGVYGDAAVAAFSIVSRYVHMCQTIYFGVGESYQSLCSFNYGAKKFERIISGFWFCIKLGIIYVLAVSSLSYLFARPIVALFRRDDLQVIQIGVLAMRAQMATLFLLPLCSTAFVMLQGIGKNGRAMLSGTARQGLFLVPILLVLPKTFGLWGIILAQPCSDILAFLISVYLVRPVLKELLLDSPLRGSPNQE